MTDFDWKQIEKAHIAVKIRGSATLLSAAEDYVRDHPSVSLAVAARVIRNPYQRDDGTFRFGHGGYPPPFARGGVISV